MSDSALYVHVEPDGKLPALATEGPFRTVIVAEAEVSPEWQSEVSNWLVRSGCLYMVAWGTNCSSWDDSVDEANLEEFSYGDIPEDKFVMTTWHSDEPLSEALWFAKNNAFHPKVDLNHTVLLHIAAQGRERELLRAYVDA
jgi:hypothetical protein